MNSPILNAIVLLFLSFNLMKHSDDPVNNPAVFTQNKSVVEVIYTPNFPKARITEQHMREIVAINPKKLSFHTVSIDPNAKKLFSKLGNLEELYLYHSNINSDDIAAFDKMARLKVINL